MRRRVNVMKLTSCTIMAYFMGYLIGIRYASSDTDPGRSCTHTPRSYHLSQEIRHVERTGEWRNARLRVFVLRQQHNTQTDRGNAMSWVKNEMTNARVQ